MGIVDYFDVVKLRISLNFFWNDFILYNFDLIEGFF